MYGDFDLQRGDRDASDNRAATWAGVVRGSSTERHVAALQRNLDTLGFDLVGSVDGGFGRRTQWALREFQIYAGMARVAREDVVNVSLRYVDRLQPVETQDARYAGPVSGRLNAETRQALAAWLENDWRCPVVIEAWTMSAGRQHTLKASNIWLHDELQSSQPRVYASDFTGYYNAPPGHDPGVGVVGIVGIVVGDFVKFDKWSGPRSVPPRHTWGAQSELTPINLIGRRHEDLASDALSTFKVVRSVSEVECLGFFDSVNSYDNAFVSVGPCHWTLGIADRNGGVDAGEMCGFLAYLEHRSPTAFEKAFGSFGAGIQAKWRETGRALFKSAQRKYSGWVTLAGENGQPVDVPRSEKEGDYFKTWHWFYRFLMAGRTVEGYRHAMWDMARIRLRDLGTTPWPSGELEPIPAADSTLRPPRLGEIFTSERALAILLRWHIRYPGDVVLGGKAGRRLRNALVAARAARGDLNWERDPRTWTDTHERTLLAALRDQVELRGNSNLSETISQVDGWPTWRTSNPRGYVLSNGIRGLSESRGSFRFDDSDLPPAPG